MDKTKIEWADSTWTPIRARYWEIQSDGSGKERIGWHCEHASEGCRHCYAEGINRRLGTGRDYAPDELYREARKGYHNGEVEVFLDEKILVQPLRWKRPRRIFPCSMTDWMADFVPDEWRDKMMAVMALCPHHTFLPLTKRAERMRDYFLSDRRAKIYDAAEEISEACSGHRSIGTGEWPLPNLWAGVSAEDQRRADERIPLLRDTPAAVRWVSLEPLLEGVDVSPWVGLSAGPHWYVVGGESGPRARPFEIEWARSIIAQCKAASVPVFMKQLGADPRDCAKVVWSCADRKGGDPDEWPSDLRVREYPTEARA